METVRPWCGGRSVAGNSRRGFGAGAVQDGIGAVCGSNVL